LKLFTKAFSLIELMVVMAIIAMAAALVVPRIGASDSVLFQADLRDALGVLKYGRRAATIQGQAVTVNLSSAAENSPRLNTEPNHWVARYATLHCGEDETQNNCNITFYPQGGSSENLIIFKFKHLSTEIKINQLTGRAALVED
jgi:general secretion pathway protein H